ncbi:MAG: MOSC domain-containing protein [Acidimicrobiales bacterium]
MTDSSSPTVAEVWRFPAKSMLGERLDAVELTPLGVLGDRGWAVRDEVRGGIRGAKKIAELMQLGARYLAPPTERNPSPHIEITLPDGSRVSSADPDVNERLSAALDHAVSLWPLQPPTDLDHYRRGAADSDDLLAELRDIFGRLEDEPLPDLSPFPPEILEYESPLGTYYDAFPLLLLTTASMRSLQALVPESKIDLRRFRPNVVLDVDADPDDPWPELAWVGKQFTLGEATIEVVTPCPRCVMITREVQELPTDRSIMRAVVRDADQNLGVYATVVERGVVRPGDRLLTKF